MTTEKYIHTRNEKFGTHCVNGRQLAGPMRIKFTFEARKHAALYLHINDVLVATKHFTGNLSAKIEYARDVLALFDADASALRDAVDGGIARIERKESDARAQVERHVRNAQELRNLKL